ncbi:hypothetical protein ACJZ2D_013842 [Fusarium nematophilum]
MSFQASKRQRMRCAHAVWLTEPAARLEPRIDVPGSDVGEICETRPQGIDKNGSKGSDLVLAGAGDASPLNEAQPTEDVEGKENSCCSWYAEQKQGLSLSERHWAGLAMECDLGDAWPRQPHNVDLEYRQSHRLFRTSHWKLGDDLGVDVRRR